MTILVGAVDEGVDGSVYVFEDDGSSWQEVDKLTASTGLGGAGAFGFSLDMESSRAVISAVRSDESGNNSGSAFIFGKTGASWNANGPANRARRGGGRFLWCFRWDSTVTQLW